MTMASMRKQTCTICSNEPEPQRCRQETDSMGTMRIPKDRLYGISTLRAIKTYPMGGQEERMPMPLITAFGIVKKAAAFVNTFIYGLDPVKSGAIIKACEDVISGQLYKDHQFPITIWQKGSGAQTNANMNEVIANRALVILERKPGEHKIINPVLHVNMSQNANDVFTSAMHIAILLEIRDKLVPSLANLKRTFEKHVKVYDQVVKVARTSLQDALLMSVDQELNAFVTQITKGIMRLVVTFPRLQHIPIGGGEIGTGYKSCQGFDERMVMELASLTGAPLQISDDKFESLSCNDTLVEVSGALNTLACSLMKISNDVKLLASGPRCGLQEVTLPQREPEDELLPGTVIPTACEILAMTCSQVMGNHVAVTVGGSHAQLQMNAFKPMMVANVLRSVRLLTDAVKLFDKNCISGMVVNTEQLKNYVAKSFVMAPLLCPVIGLRKTKAIVNTAFETQQTLKEVVMENELLNDQDYDRFVQPQFMMRPRDCPLMDD